MKCTQNYGYATYGDGVPSGLSLKQERMVETCSKLRTTISVLESELYDFKDAVEHFAYLDSKSKDRIIYEYDKKIHDRKQEYDDIKENLERQGVKVGDYED